MALFVLAGCSAADTTSETSTATTVRETTTTLATTTTTQSARGWLDESFVPAVDSYNSEFGLAYQEHASNLEFSAAQLDCVEALPLVSGWRDTALPAPDPQLDALAVRFFDVLEAAIRDCTEALTIGDFRAVSRSLQSLQEIADRILDRALGG